MTPPSQQEAACTDPPLNTRRNKKTKKTKKKSRTAVGLSEAPMTNRPTTTRTAGVSEVSDTQVVVKPGDDATLQCRAPRDGSIEKLAWRKTDLKSDNYVFFFRENRSYENYQLDSFRGRVELLDPQMKQGDTSVVLKKVTASDSGPYECSVFTSRGGGGRRKRAAEFRHTVHLKDEDSGPEAGGSEERGSQEGGSQEGGSQEEGNLRGHPGLMGLVAVPVVIAVLGFGFLVYKRPMKKNPEQPAADEQLQLSSTEPAEVQCQSEV